MEGMEEEPVMEDMETTSEVLENKGFRFSWDE
jgi:hypothetical protein